MLTAGQPMRVAGLCGPSCDGLTSSTSRLASHILFGPTDWPAMLGPNYHP